MLTMKSLFVFMHISQKNASRYRMQNFFYSWDKTSLIEMYCTYFIYVLLRISELNSVLSNHSVACRVCYKPSAIFMLLRNSIF
jgi:hypothetical protein